MRHHVERNALGLLNAIAVSTESRSDLLIVRLSDSPLVTNLVLDLIQISKVFGKGLRQRSEAEAEETRVGYCNCSLRMFVDDSLAPVGGCRTALPDM